MSKARITFTYNNGTGKREIHIDYESDPSSLSYEHEEEHRNLVKRIIDMQSLQQEEEVIELARDEKVEAETPSLDQEGEYRSRTRTREGT